MLSDRACRVVMGFMTDLNADRETCRFCGGPRGRHRGLNVGVFIHNDGCRLASAQDALATLCNASALLGEARNWVQDPELRAKIKVVAPPSPRPTDELPL